MKQLITTKIEYNANKQEVKRYLFYVINMDSSDNIVEETEYDQDSNIISRLAYKYSDSGLITENIEYGISDELVEKQTDTLNENNEVVKSIVEYGDGTMIIKDIELSDSGSQIEEIMTNEDGDLIGRTIYLQDEDGQTSTLIETDPDGIEMFKRETTYTVDGWIEK